MHYIPRYFENTISSLLNTNPCVAILGPRQCGKSTLARHLLRNNAKALFLDLELPSDLNKIRNPELFLRQHTDSLVCFDEIQRVPELFSVLRSFIDNNPDSAKFLILGSASRDLIRQSSETLAGRISYVELTPFMLRECNLHQALSRLWLRGGFPRSFLAPDDIASYRWRHDFIRSFIERDILQIHSGASSDKAERLLRMCAHTSGQTVNYSKLASSLDMSDNTVRHYLELLAGGFLLRILRPHFVNIKKRLVKSPKIYVRDSGILHALLGVETFDGLLSNPEYGASWEGMAIENILPVLKPSVQTSFYRTAKGEEVDLVLEKGDRRVLVECKAGTSPQVTSSLRTSIADLSPDHTWIVSPIEDAYPIGESISATSLSALLADSRLSDYLL